MKFHWKPVLGVHGLVWDEALTLNGVDPDFHRRDLYNAIGAGAFPEWELGVQVMPDSDDQYFNGHRPARLDEARARGAGAGAADRPDDA